MNPPHMYVYVAVCGRMWPYVPMSSYMGRMKMSVAVCGRGCTWPCVAVSGRMWLHVAVTGCM